VSDRTNMQEDLDPRCVWVVSEPKEEERRCMRPAKWLYEQRVQRPNKLPSVERYTMCGKHASPRNRERAQAMGYQVREINPYEPATHQAIT